ncbi:MAG TPA: ABC transporter ATP-binding protein [Ruminococcus sp.]|nr:ABC transporter ATP-binding protein [Ruminococcus sp.]
MKDTILEVKELSAGYGSKAIVSGVSFTVKCGEMLTLIGPNGAGKSTLLKTIAAQLPPVSGDIVLNGHRLTQMAARDIARSVSLLLTERVSAEKMTCMDVVDTGRYPYTGRLGILSEEDRKAVREAMELTSVSDIADRPFSLVSDGQRQLVMLARAIAQDTPILILDEPTSYLDIGHKLCLQELLRALMSEKNTTVIQSLHELELAQKYSDRIICINNGTAELSGSPDEVFTDSQINSIFSIKSGSYNSLFGSTEACILNNETPQVFVIGGGGKAVPLYRRLGRQGIPFAAGIIPENDVEYSIVTALTTHVISVPPYSNANVESLNTAKEMMQKCDTVICCNDLFCPELCRYASDIGKLR